MSKPVETPKVSEIEVIASGLDSPRKLSFGPDGVLYVAEASILFLRKDQ
jgi:glucose/arabinose dehydrogenase